MQKLHKIFDKLPKNKSLSKGMFDVQRLSKLSLKLLKHEKLLGEGKKWT